MMEIAAQDLTKRYRNGTVALDALSITLQVGTIHGLLGSNGAGKSTFLRLCATLDTPTEGDLTVAGQDVRDRTAHRHIRDLLGYLPQDYRLYDDLTPWEYLTYMGVLKELPTVDTEVQRVLEAVDLTSEASSLMGGFSGGMKQRVGVAQALLGDPRVLLLDEPTAGLDPVQRRNLRNALVQLADRCLVILSTHIVEDVSQMCSSVSVLQRGHLVFHDTPMALATSAKGWVWEVDVPHGSLDLSEAGVLYTAPTATGMRYRVQSRSKPHPDARLVEEPSLEDAFLCLSEPAPETN